MIKISKTVVKGLCDACGKALSTEDQTRHDGTPFAAHYGELNNHFGYGSPLDGIDGATGRLVLCEDCYMKAMEALNIPLSQWSTPWHVYFTSERFGEDEMDKFWHEPIWHCVFCDWTEQSRGYSTPNHSCPNTVRILHESPKICPLCEGADVNYQSHPIYSERVDGWLHWVKRGLPHPRENPPCLANGLILPLMRADERINPEFHARMKAADGLLEKHREEHTP